MKEPTAKNPVSTPDRGKSFDVVVIGGGHAAVEAAAACARKGHRTLMMVLNLDSIAFLACNPSIGGTSKGNLVKEIDALGGLQARLADACLVQLRMLNASKGVAVQSLRAQIDKNRYHAYVKHVLERTENLTLRQAEATEILRDGSGVTAVKTARGQTYSARAVIVCTGVYLRSNIIVGDRVVRQGPAGFCSADQLSDSLIALGHPLRRFKTGTPPRIDAKTVDYARLEIQQGEDVAPFSALTDSVDYNGAACYLGYTNAHTHDIIRANLSKSGKYSGKIRGTGARYCPSIEDKIVRFADKERHQFFLEPEAADTDEVYVQGLSTSLPADVQEEMIRSIPGLDHAQIMRDSYAIEYDCIDSLTLNASLESKTVPGLFFAGQINGTSGYEEAAAQGLVAGVNAALSLENRAPMILSRDVGYIGVLVDDLVTKGTDEPYRMMTSRAEHRLKLRQADSDLRLTPIGREIGLVGDEQYARYQQKVRGIETVRARLDEPVKKEILAPLFAACGEPYGGDTLFVRDVLKRGKITPEAAAKLPALADCRLDCISSVTYDCKYEGYLLREDRAIAEAKRLEETVIPDGFLYEELQGLRIEARQKLAAVRPRSVGQASRIPGVNPADVTVLLLTLKTKADSRKNVGTPTENKKGTSV